MNKIKDRSLYLVISEEYGAGRVALEIARLAIAGGVDIVQMREKNKTRPELILLGSTMSKLCKKSGVIFIVNDDPELVVETGSDGVHLGQEDAKKCPVSEARRVIGKDKIIGISTHSYDEFKAANETDVDYVAFGPILPTKTKDYCVGTKDIARILEIAKKPVFFIGGINISNIDDILKLGARNIALIRDIVQAQDITERTRMFKERLTLSKAVKT